MQKTRQIAFCVLALLLLLMPLVVRAENGQAVDMITLDGPCEIYWDQLITPDALANATPSGTAYANQSWSIGTGYPENGCATYVIRTSFTAAENKPVSLYLPVVYTDYALYVNGQLLSCTGAFAQNESLYPRPQALTLPPQDGNEYEIVLQVANKLAPHGGLNGALRIGNTDTITNSMMRLAILDCMMIAICLFAGIDFAFLYLFNRKRRGNLQFALICLAVAFRSLMSNQMLITVPFPNASYGLIGRLMMMTPPLIVAPICALCHDFYASPRVRGNYPILQAINLLYFLLSIFLPLSAEDMCLSVYLVIVLGEGLVLGIYILYKHMHGDWQAISNLMQLLLLMSFAVFDLLVYRQIIRMPYLYSLCLTLLIIFSGITFARENSRELARANVLNQALQQAVQENKQMKLSYTQHLMRPHFIFNALSMIAEYCEIDPSEAARLTIAFSTYLRRVIDFRNMSGRILMADEAAHVRAFSLIEELRFPDIHITIDIPPEFDTLELPPVVLQPLVENAVNHGLRKRRGGGHIDVLAARAHGGTRVSVRDDGVGIAPELMTVLPHAPADGTGIGLYDINNRLTAAFGSGLHIESSPRGTTVSFFIPDFKADKGEKPCTE